MTEQIIIDINRVKHLRIYELAIKRNDEVSASLIISFLFMVAFAWLQCYWIGAIFASLFTVPILLISIDRAIQLVQLNRIKKRYGITDRMLFNNKVTQSNHPWMEV